MLHSDGEKFVFCALFRRTSIPFLNYLSCVVRTTICKWMISCGFQYYNEAFVFYLPDFVRVAYNVPEMFCCDLPSPAFMCYITAFDVCNLTQSYMCLCCNNKDKGTALDMLTFTCPEGLVKTFASPKPQPKGPQNPRDRLERECPVPLPLLYFWHG